MLRLSSLTKIASTLLGVALFSTSVLALPIQVFELKDQTSHAHFTVETLQFTTLQDQAVAEAGVLAEIQRYQREDPTLDLSATYYDWDESLKQDGPSPAQWTPLSRVKQFVQNTFKKAAKPSDPVFGIALNQKAYLGLKKNYPEFLYNSTTVMLIRAGVPGGVNGLMLLAGHLPISASMIYASSIFGACMLSAWQNPWLSKFQRNLRVWNKTATVQDDAAPRPEMEKFLKTKLGKVIEGLHSGFNFSLTEIAFGAIIVGAANLARIPEITHVATQWWGFGGFFFNVVVNSIAQGTYDAAIGHERANQIATLVPRLVAQGLTDEEAKTEAKRLALPEFRIKGLWGSNLSVLGFALVSTGIPQATWTGRVLLGALTIWGVKKLVALNQSTCDEIWTDQASHLAN